MHIEDLLKKKNIKLTSARVTLLKLLEAAQKPLSYEDIKESISMDKATFYRNMTKFEQEGLLNAFESNNKMRYFELKLTPHAHFVCIVCHRVECIKNIDISLADYEIHTVVINGKCKNCI